MSDLVVWEPPPNWKSSGDNECDEDDRRFEETLRETGFREIVLRQKGWPDFPYTVYVVVDE